MSKYTTQVRFICENAADETESVGFDSIDRIISKAIPKIFDFSFPIWDENYRTVLCTKILKHYYMREIGCETVGLWKLFLSRRLQEIMPYYNKLYETTILDFDPLMDVSYKREYDKSGSESKEAEGSKEENGEDSRSKSRDYSRTEGVEESAETSGENKRTKSGNAEIETAYTDSATENGGRTVNKEHKSEEEFSGNISKEESGSSSNNSEDNNTTSKAFSDTPQGGLENVENLTYLSTFGQDKGVAESSSNSTNSSESTESDSHNKTDNGTSKETETNNKSVSGEKNGTEKTVSSETDNTTNNENRSVNLDRSVEDTESGKENGTRKTNSSYKDSGNIDTTEKYIESISGKMGNRSYASMIIEFRNTLIDVDTMVVNALDDLFMQIW